MHIVPPQLACSKPLLVCTFAIQYVSVFARSAALLPVHYWQTLSSGCSKQRHSVARLRRVLCCAMWRVGCNSDCMLAMLARASLFLCLMFQKHIWKNVLPSACVLSLCPRCVVPHLCPAAPQARNRALEAFISAQLIATAVPSHRLTLCSREVHLCCTCDWAFLVNNTSFTVCVCRAYPNGHPKPFQLL